MLLLRWPSLLLKWPFFTFEVVFEAAIVVPKVVIVALEVCDNELFTHMSILGEVVEKVLSWAWKPLR